MKPTSQELDYLKGIVKGVTVTEHYCLAYIELVLSELELGALKAFKNSGKSNETVSSVSKKIEDSTLIALKFAKPELDIHIGKTIKCSKYCEPLGFKYMEDEESLDSIIEKTSIIGANNKSSFEKTKVRSYYLIEVPQIAAYY